MTRDTIPISRAAVVGAGVIGAGWAARLIWHGVDVTVADPHAQAEVRCRAVLDNAERALLKLHGARPGSPGSIRFTTEIADAVADAEFIQESAPEDLDLKQRILTEIEAHAPASALIGTSTSGLLPTKLQSALRHPERFVVAHPFNPVYLLPLVEICGGAETGEDAITRAKSLFAALGMYPLHVRHEIDGFIADRLLEALWREALWLVNDGVATVSEVDDAIRYGAGLRWAMMGSFMTYRIAGGADGMRHFMAQFGPALKWPWTKLTDVPELTDELLDRIAAQSDAQADGQDLRTLERQRDDGLIGILHALKPLGLGAGALLEYPAATASELNIDAAAPLPLHRTTVLPDWIDYNGHMTEHRYLQVFGETADALLAAIGMDAEMLASGRSFYTVESHLRHLDEAHVGDALYVTTQILGIDDKRIHAFHRMWRAGDDTLIATAEQLYLHVDSTAGRATAADDAVLATLERLARAHADLPTPEGAGRSVAISGPRSRATTPIEPQDDGIAPLPDFEVYPTVASIDAASAWGDGVEVAWSDGHTSRFHGLWLRDNCPCADCVNPLTREQVFDISTVPDDIAPRGIAVDRTGALALDWPDGHRSRYHPGWLRAHCYTEPVDAERTHGHDRQTWTSGFAPSRFDGDRVLKDDGALLAWLEALDTQGIAILENCPLTPGAVEWFADRIAFLRRTNFGRVFDVRSKPDADSNAYTALELPLHTDLPTRELQPGLQFLLCRVNEATGGDSIMADGFAIADALRAERPDFFETLTTLPMAFKNRARTSDYRLRTPAIRLDESGRVTEVRIGNFLRGPQRVPEDEMPRLYAAYRHLLTMTREERFKVRFRLNAGEMSSFDNRRVLHARTAFDPASGARHLQGCYVDTDEIASRLRVLRRHAEMAAMHRDAAE